MKNYYDYYNYFLTKKNMVPQIKYRFPTIDETLEVSRLDDMIAEVVAKYTDTLTNMSKEIIYLTNALQDVNLSNIKQDTDLSKLYNYTIDSELKERIEKLEKFWVENSAFTGIKDTVYNENLLLSSFKDDKDALYEITYNDDFNPIKIKHNYNWIINEYNINYDENGYFRSLN